MSGVKENELEVLMNKVGRLDEIMDEMGLSEDFGQSKLLRDVVENIGNGLALLRVKYFGSSNDRNESIFEYLFQLGNELGYMSQWSMCTSSMNKIDDLFPHQDVKELVYRDHWGEIGPVTVYVVPKKKDAITFRDVWAAAELAIQRSGDEHHVFIEEIRRIDDHGTYEIFTGS